MRVYLGIDWSQSKHDLCLLNEAGAVVAELTIPHQPEGFEQLDDLRRTAGVAASECWVGLETAHNLAIDFLWARGYHQVFVIPPNAVKSARGRYRQTNAHTDRSDAYVIADMLRTDQARLQPWHPDGDVTQQLRAKVSLVLHLTHTIRRLDNRLQAVLGRYYPAARHVFHDTLTLVGLRFLQAFPTPQAATALTRAAFSDFVRAQHYTRSEQMLLAAYARLTQPYPQAAPVIVAAYQAEAVLLAELLERLLNHKMTQLKTMQLLFHQHPDATVFASLPGVGDFLAPALLAKFGDDRERFPDAASVQCLAGTCPVTEASGKRKVIRFRRACDHEFRWLVQQWALQSLNDSVWAVAYWKQVRARGGSRSHAYRCLANRWLAIAWKCWHMRQPYDEAYHLHQRARRSQPRS